MNDEDRQLQLITEREEQRQGRDSALDRLEGTRSDLIAVADRIARRLVRENGVVTSSDVFREMRASGFQLDGYDPRWMGAVFRTGKGWRKIGYTPDGSHSRPVAIWEEASL